MFQYFGPFLSPSFSLFFLSSALSLSFKVYNCCQKVHTLVWWQCRFSPPFLSSLFLFFILLLFLSVAPHQRSREGPFVSDFTPTAVVLQGRLIITEYTTSGKTISGSLMSNMRETKITKKRVWRGKVLKVGLSFCLSLSLALFLSFGSISCYCCCLLFGSALKHKGGTIKKGRLPSGQGGHIWEARGGHVCDECREDEEKELKSWTLCSLVVLIYMFTWLEHIS